MRVLVTGGCGFIGVNLVNRLLQTDAQVFVLDNQSAGKLEDLQGVAPAAHIATIDSLPIKPAKGVWFTAGDIRDPRVAERVTAGLDAIVHLAAHADVVHSVEQPRHDMEVNIVGTLNLLEGARVHHIKRFVFASSAATFGEQEPPLDEDKPVKPSSPYGASKVAGEAYCSAYWNSYGIETISLRFSNVYGPRSVHKGTVISLFIKQVLEKQPLVIYGDGKQTRDYLYVDDLLDAICTCLSPDTNGIGGEAFQIATGTETNVNEITGVIQKLASRSGFKVNISNAPARTGEVYRNYASIDKARRCLAYNPKIDVDRGIQATWEWFMNNKAKL
jgi:UDP-glucose 4-epimerase